MKKCQPFFYNANVQQKMSRKLQGLLHRSLDINKPYDLEFIARTPLPKGGDCSFKKFAERGGVQTFLG